MGPEHPLQRPGTRGKRSHDAWLLPSAPSILLHPGALIRFPHYWAFATEATDQTGLPAASPPRMSVAPTNELLGNFPSLWGRPPASARPPGGARPSRWLTGAGGRRTHLVGRWSYGGGGGRAQGQVQSPDFKWRRPYPRRGPRTWSWQLPGFLRREGGAQRPGTPGARGRAGAKRRLHDARRRPRCDSSDLRARATGCHLTFWICSTVSWAPAVLRLYLESFGQNVVLRPRGCPRPWTSEPRGSFKSSSDPRAYLRCDFRWPKGSPEVSYACRSGRAGSEERG